MNTVCLTIAKDRYYRLERTRYILLDDILRHINARDEKAREYYKSFGDENVTNCKILPHIEIVSSTSVITL